MLETLSVCPYPYKRIPAIRLDRQPEELGYKMIPRLRGAAGVASIFLSHCRALEDALAAGINGKFALLEDDVRIDNDFWSLGVEERFIETEYDILFFSPRYRPKSPDESGARPFIPSPLGLGLVDLTAAMGEFIVTGAHFLVFRDRDTIERTLLKLRDCKEILDVDLFYMLHMNCCGLHLDCVGTAALGSDHSVKGVEFKGG